MKTRLIFLVVLIVCFSCGTNNKPVSDAQKEKIKGEVKEVVNTFIRGCEEANFDMAIEPFLDSPDFVDLVNGKILSYKELMAMRPNFNIIFYCSSIRFILHNGKSVFPHFSLPSA